MDEFTTSDPTLLHQPTHNAEEALKKKFHRTNVSLTFGKMRNQFMTFPMNQAVWGLLTNHSMWAVLHSIKDDEESRRIWQNSRSTKIPSRRCSHNWIISTYRDFHVLGLHLVLANGDDNWKHISLLSETLGKLMSTTVFVFTDSVQFLGRKCVEYPESVSESMGDTHGTFCSKQRKPRTLWSYDSTIIQLTNLHKTHHYEDSSRDQEDDGRENYF